MVIVQNVLIWAIGGRFSQKVHGLGDISISSNWVRPDFMLHCFSIHTPNRDRGWDIQHVQQRIWLWPRLDIFSWINMSREYHLKWFSNYFCQSNNRRLNCLYFCIFRCCNRCVQGVVHGIRSWVFLHALVKKCVYITKLRQSRNQSTLTYYYFVPFIYTDEL